MKVTLTLRPDYCRHLDSNQEPPRWKWITHHFRTVAGKMIAMDFFGALPLSYSDML